MWTENIDSDEVDCPSCGGKFSFSVEDALNSRTVKCSCGQEIKLDGSELKKALDGIEKSFKKLKI
jgi:transcription elongation factor Elf1